MKNLKNIIASIILVVISFVSYTQYPTLEYKFYLTDTNDIENVDTHTVTNVMHNLYTDISEDTMYLGELNSKMSFTTNDNTYKIFLFTEYQYNMYANEMGGIYTAYNTEDVILNSWDWDIGDDGGWDAVVYDNIDSLIPHLIKDTTIFYILIETIENSARKIINTKINYTVAAEETTSNDNEDDDASSIDTEVIEVSNTRVYPNPVMNSLNIEFETINTDTEVEIYSTTGQLMYKDVEYRNFGINKVSVDMSNYPSGMYIVRLGNVVKKVIKQ